MFKLLPQRWFYIPFIGVICTNMMFITIVDWITVILDKRCRWEQGFTKRATLQLLFGWFLPLVLAVLFSQLYFGILHIEILPILYSRHLFPMIFTLSLLVSVGYAGYYFNYLFNKHWAYAGNNSSGQQYPDHLIFFSGVGSEMKVQVDDIAYICGHGKNLILQPCFSAPLLLGLTSLKHIAAKLDPYHFLLVNRSYIIARKAYRGHKKYDRGLVLTLEPRPGEPVKVSEANKDFFLEWINAQKELEHRNTG
ncbi:LytTR family transcriptional regulator DNA-binding domain-containing protein [Pedobacter sp. NJ-S-72]